MPDYKYKTIDVSGKIRSENMVASNPKELEKRVNSMGFDLLSVKEQGTGTGVFLRKKTIGSRELINFTFHIEQLIKSGVPLLDSLKDIRDSFDYSHFTDVLQTIIDDIEGGKTLSLALSSHPQIFDKVYVTLVRVGEETGQLDTVLNELTQMLRWQDELASKIKKIMIYPIIVAAVVLSVVTFLMMYLMPQLVPFIKATGTEIPAYTQLLINVSAAFVNYWYIMFSVPFIIYVIFKMALKSNPQFRYFIDGAKLKMWLFGPLATKIKLARFANYFAMMYSSGITVLDSLRISEDMIDNTVLKEGINIAREQIADGTQISTSFENTNVFPSMIVRMLRVGEDTGAMDVALMNVGYFYDREVKESIEKIEPVIMPVLTLILATMLGWIAIAVFGPIYDTFANVKF